jgi:hypothetical protein
MARHDDFEMVLACLPQAERGEGEALKALAGRKLCNRAQVAEELYACTFR